METKTALVTGSTSGIGLAISKALAEAGYRLILNGLGSPEEIESSVSAVEAVGTQQPTFIGTDLTNPDAIQIALDEILSAYNGIDILVNNAGAQFISPIHQFPVNRWDNIIALNLSACFHTIRLVLPKMFEKNFGRIINIASVHGLVASVNKAAYVTTKHGVIGLTKATALETAETGVTCNAICPGWTQTSLIKKQVEQRATELNIGIAESELGLLDEKQPSKQFVTANQLAMLTRFLCSEDAAQITGASIPVDGGWTAQ